jgi:antitoxin MazE
MEAVVRKWGNSLGVRIPNHIIRGLSLKDGSLVNIINKENEIVIKPIRKKTLSEMLNKINDQNLHSEIETGESVGNEIW